MMEAKFKEADRILIVNLFELEDIIFTIPMLRNLKDILHCAQIDMVGLKRFKDLKNDLSLIDNYYSYPEEKSLKGKYDFAKKLSKNNYDLGITVDQRIASTLILKLAKPKYSFGFDDVGASFLLNETVHRNTEVHMVEMYSEFLEELGFTGIKNEGPKISVQPEEAERVAQFLKQEGYSADKKLVGINITTRSNHLKTWSKKGFAKLADILEAEYGAQVIFYSAPEDMVEVEEVVSQMETKPLVATNKIPLSLLPALAKECELFISGDSGEIHAASAVGTKTITLFGPTDPARFKPYSEQAKIVESKFDCRPDDNDDAVPGNVICSEGITVSDILAKVEL